MAWPKALIRKQLPSPLTAATLAHKRVANSPMLQLWRLNRRIDLSEGKYLDKMQQGGEEGTPAL